MTAYRELLVAAQEIHVSLARAGYACYGLLTKDDLPLVAPWDPGVSELNLLVRPLMERAGLGELDVFFELYRGQTQLRGLAGSESARPAHGPAIWYDTIEDGLCYFGAEAEAVSSPERCVLGAAQAVAQAARVSYAIDNAAACPPRTLAITAVLLGHGLCLLGTDGPLTDHEVVALLAFLADGEPSLSPAEVAAALPAALAPTFWERSASRR